MKIIGITGGIGCGKSRVCAYLKERYDAEVITADDIGRDVVRTGTEGNLRLRELLGDEYFFEDGSLNRKKTGDFAFKNPDILERMNEIIHPAVFDAVNKRLAEAFEAKRELAVIEAALLIGTKYREICSEFWDISADKQTRLKRLEGGRNITRDKALRVMDSQMSQEEFANGCEVVIDNSGDFAKTREQVDIHIRDLL